MMDEPRFAQPIPNVTVAVGRDANLPCVVEHLGAYKVNRSKLLFSLCADESGRHSRKYDDEKDGRCMRRIHATIKTTAKIC